LFMKELMKLIARMIASVLLRRKTLAVPLTIGKWKRVKFL